MLKRIRAKLRGAEPPAPLPTAKAPTAAFIVLVYFFADDRRLSENQTTTPFPPPTRCREADGKAAPPSPSTPT
jgi:hypothetical protein